MRIMLVDDEPFFLENLREVIQQCGHNLQLPIHIVSECYSAEKAISEIPVMLPDLIFTDIRMTDMDGLELAQHVRDEWPHIKTIIVSGYPSFDYARTALKANVVDYLVKPIEPAIIMDVLKQAASHMQEHIYLRKHALLQYMLKAHVSADIEHISIAAQPSFQSLAIVALHSSVFQFNPLLYDQHTTKFNTDLKQLRGILGSEEEVWAFTNPNKKGVYFIFEFAIHEEARLHEISQFLLNSYSTPESCAIVAYSSFFSDVHETNKYARLLTSSLDYHYVIGKNQLLTEEQLKREGQSSYLTISDVQLNTLNYLGQKQDWKSIQQLIKELFQEWENVQCPAFIIEIELRKVTKALGYSLEERDPKFIREMEVTIQELLFDSANFEEAGQAFTDWLEAVMKPSELKSEKRSEVLFQQIEHYIAANLAQPLTLQTLTDKFDISSTYLCNLFRIHSSSSFVEHLTEQRLLKAKRLLAEQTDMPIKDIAEIVGYIDRHYFSKVFKTYEGRTPSEYRSSMIN